MERNAGYEIKRLLLYDDNKGFALGENLRAPDPYVTWKVTAVSYTHLTLPTTPYV